MTRREIFGRLLRRESPPPAGSAAVPVEPAPGAADAALVAVISARHCLSMPPGFCRTCVERCPVAGALVIAGGVPTVIAGLCTGCAICHDVCPAPRNAVLLLPRKSPAPIPHAC